MDTIYIEDLKVTTRIGVCPWEQTLPQHLLITLEFSVDAAQLSQEDNIKNAVDYSAVAEFISVFADKAHFQLLETLANTLAHSLQKAFPLPWLRLTIKKPGAIRGAKQTAVVIERCNIQGDSSTQI